MIGHEKESGGDQLGVLPRKVGEEGGRGRRQTARRRRWLAIGLATERERERKKEREREKEKKGEVERFYSNLQVIYFT